MLVLKNNKDQKKNNIFYNKYIFYLIKFKFIFLY